jgi:L-ribulose-5-phosphate 4-epimerase
MHENEKTDILSTAFKLLELDLIKLDAGNISVRKDNHIIVTPSGKDYKELDIDDMVVMDLGGEKIEGTNIQSLDTVGLLYIYNNLPDVNAIIHTHQSYATAISLIQDELPVILTPLVNAVGASKVFVTPFVPAAKVESGIAAVDYLKNGRAVILRQHGVITVGKNLTEALYAAVYLEEAAKSYLAVYPATNIRVLTDEQAEQAINSFQNYHK